MTNTTYSKTAAALTGPTVNHRTEASGRRSMTVRAGSKVAWVREEPDGRAYVSLSIDYGEHGRSFVDARTYASPSAALRFVRSFVGGVA